MEVIGIIVLIAIGWVIIQSVFSTDAKTINAETKAGTLSENLEIRFNDMQVGETGSTFLAKKIEGKGLFPLHRTTRVGFVTSVLDMTSDEPEPVLSAIEDFQESGTVAYQNIVEVGLVSPDQGFINWVELGVILPEILQPPFSGERRLVAVLCMIDLDNPPTIICGFSAPDQSGLLWMSTLEFIHNFQEMGYQEAAEHHREAMVLSLKVGVAVAMADGSLDDREGEILKTWIIRVIEPFTEKNREALKVLYNEALKEAYLAARSGDLSLSELTRQLNEIGEKHIKYMAVELCFDIMAADGVADSEEMKTIRRVAEDLELDLDEIERMRDQKIVALDTSVSDQASLEDLLGIEADWSKERKHKYLRIEFQKWNNRLNTLPEGTERDNAQRMLDLIGEARRKCDCRNKHD